ncbi:hypothetical protein Naga_100634g2 [Nannochloropsis gaditana]|uniref:Uncharacterized protein n=1 Tax=Nannochloropsis gaditana TaxID=72520 RepID=W7TTT5_9STRA|nr:hypothetical protein Naga_100634g2 [Nannochloropsis gaditana]
MRSTELIGGLMRRDVYACMRVCQYLYKIDDCETHSRPERVRLCHPECFPNVPSGMKGNAAESVKGRVLRGSFDRCAVPNETWVHKGMYVWG